MRDSPEPTEHAGLRTPEWPDGGGGRQLRRDPAGAPRHAPGARRASLTAGGHLRSDEVLLARRLVRQVIECHPSGAAADGT